ncbi:hypothetical protein WJX75_000029 [Coccomyxa subellipsoidea]|uniref:Uncharacterized protein n=1 Tax=Coccomyxa subellipsoidea TaxID=248742 RepID=A0ABR2YB80_9CHLO
MLTAGQRAAEASLHAAHNRAQISPGQGNRRALPSSNFHFPAIKIMKSGLRTTAVTATKEGALPVSKGGDLLAANACQAPMSPPAMPTDEGPHSADIPLADCTEAAAQPEKICGFRTQRRTPKRKSTSDSEGSAGQGGVKCEYTGTNYHNGVYRTSIYYAKPGSGPNQYQFGSFDIELEGAVTYDQICILIFGAPMNFHRSNYAGCGGGRSPLCSNGTPLAVATGIPRPVRAAAQKRPCYTEDADMTDLEAAGNNELPAGEGESVWGCNGMPGARSYSDHATNTAGPSPASSLEHTPSCSSYGAPAHNGVPVDSSRMIKRCCTDVYRSRGANFC